MSSPNELAAHMTIVGKREGEPDVDLETVLLDDVPAALVRHNEYNDLMSGEYDSITVRDFNEEEARACEDQTSQLVNQAYEYMAAIAISLNEKRLAGTPKADAEADEIIRQLSNIEQTLDDAVADARQAQSDCK